jgi:hypothetical protein
MDLVGPLSAGSGLVCFGKLELIIIVEAGWKRRVALLNAPAPKHAVGATVEDESHEHRRSIFHFAKQNL